MTFREFSILEKGWQWRQDHRHRQTSFALSFIMAGLTRGKRSPREWYKLFTKNLDTQDDRTKMLLKRDRERAKKIFGRKRKGEQDAGSQ